MLIKALIYGIVPKVICSFLPLALLSQSYSVWLLVESERGANPGVRSQVVVGFAVVVHIARVRRVAAMSGAEPPGRAVVPCLQQITQKSHFLSTTILVDFFQFFSVATSLFKSFIAGVRLLTVTVSTQSIIRSSLL